MCPKGFTSDTNDYSLVTSLMRNKDAYKCARITLNLEISVQLAIGEKKSQIHNS